MTVAERVTRVETSVEGIRREQDNAVRESEVQSVALRAIVDTRLDAMDQKMDEGFRSVREGQTWNRRLGLAIIGSILTLAVAIVVAVFRKDIGA